jgi:hypothetical protein
MLSQRSPTWSTVAVCVMVAASSAPVHTLTRSRTRAVVQDRVHVLNSWANVAALASGTRLRVELTDRTRIAGRLQSVSPDRLVVLAQGGAGTVAWRRDEVARVEQRGGPRVKLGAGWGALVGVLVGAITLGTIEPKDAVTNGVLLWHELPVLVTGTAIGAGAGSAINLARRHWVAVYESLQVGSSRSETLGRQSGTSRLTRLGRSLDGREVCPRGTQAPRIATLRHFVGHQCRTRSTRSGASPGHPSGRRGVGTRHGAGV